MTVEAPQNLGKYQLLALLATGGMAEIYLAKLDGEPGFEHLVVIKRIFPHLAKQQRFVEMFFDEANIAAKLRHPNVVHIYELGKDGEEYFIAMEYLEGESLGYLIKQLRKTERDLPAALAAGIVAQVCDGLDYAHRLCDDAGKPMNIVHRDVSPHNIIILNSGGVKLVDFGIAKAAHKIHKTRVGTLKGKLTYISPEQYKSVEVDARSDVFSLGVVLWELLTRQRLFKRESEKEMMRATLTGNIPRVKELQPDTPLGLDEVTQKALQRSPAERYQSAAEMGEALRQVLSSLNAAAGNDDIGRFVAEFFGDRAQTKQLLLQEIQSHGAIEVEVPTKKSMPRPTFDSEIEEDEDLAKLVTPLEPDRALAEVSTANVPHPLRKELKTAFPSDRVRQVLWLTAPVVSLLVIILVLLFTGERPRPEAAPEPSPPKRDAVLRILSRPPDCEVELDGVRIAGRTPIETLVVAGENREVAVLCDGYQRESKRLGLGEAERITLDFAPGLLVVPPVVKPIRTEESEPKVRVRQRVRMGQLLLDTVPWSEIYLGGRKLGVTPLIDTKLPVGTHRLTAQNLGKNLKKTFEVTIQAGKTTKLKVNLAE